MLAKIAWRNLWRNKTRTSIVVVAIAISYGLMLFLFGISQDSYQKMTDNIVEAVGGHVLIHGEGYWDLPTGGQSVADPSAKRARLEDLEGVEAVAERVMAFGLLGTATTSEGAQVVGVRPEDERAFLDLQDRLVEGAIFSEDRSMPLVIDADTAATLGVGIGDRVVLTATDLDGEVTRGLFFLDGLLTSTPGTSGEGRAYVRLEDLQQLLGYGDKVTQIGLRIADDERRYLVAAAVQEFFEGESIEVLTWDEAVPEFLALIEFDRVFTYFYLFIVVFIVVLGITNTFMMAVMERIREIGLFSALGLGPGRIGGLIMLETAFVTAVGMGAGLVLGLIGHFYVDARGIDMAEITQMDLDVSGVTMDLVVHSHLDVGLWVTGSVVIFLFICAASLYPAWKATRLAPAEAMRFFE